MIFHLKNQSQYFSFSAKSFLLFFGISITSCSLFQDNLSYYDQMEEEKTAIIGAEQDYPLVTGDQTISKEDQKQALIRRTPLSPEDRLRYDYDTVLKHELDALEQSQNQEFFKHYWENHRYLPSVSERIYFLKLPGIAARERYLRGKGARDDGPTPIFHGPDEHRSIIDRQLIPGMSKMGVIASWGHPSKIEVAGNPKYENERWTFYRRGHRHYVFFENGKLDRFTENSQDAK